MGTVITYVLFHALRVHLSISFLALHEAVADRSQGCTCSLTWEIAMALKASFRRYLLSQVLCILFNLLLFQTPLDVEAS